MEELVQEAIDCPDDPIEPSVVAEEPAESIEAPAMSEKRSASEVPPAAETGSQKGSVKEGAASPDVKSVQKSISQAAEEAAVEEIQAPKEPSICDNISEDEETVPNVREELRQCGILIREILLDGREIPDELYVRLFVNKLRCRYEYKSPQVKMDEVKAEAQEVCDINARIGEIDREMLTDLKEK